MKKLIISMKSNKQIFNDAKKVMKAIKEGRKVKNHYEISFESRKDFNKFVKHLHILMFIQNDSPASIYELAQIAGVNVSNLRRIISFFETVGAINIEENVVSGRKVKRPVVDYDKIEFDLKAA